MVSDLHLDGEVYFMGEICCVKGRNGASPRVWVDRWLDDDGLRAPWIKNDFTDPGLMVNELIDFELRDWNIQKIEEHFFPTDVLKIRAVKLVVSLEDIWIWKLIKSGDSRSN